MRKAIAHFRFDDDAARARQRKTQRPKVRVVRRRAAKAIPLTHSIFIRFILCCCDSILHWVDIENGIMVFID